MLTQIVVQHTSVGEDEVHNLMATPNNPPHGQVGDAAVDMRDEVETCGTVPCAVHKDVLEIVTHELADLRFAVDVGQQL